MLWVSSSGRDEKGAPYPEGQLLVHILQGSPTGEIPSLLPTRTFSTDGDPVLTVCIQNDFFLTYAEETTPSRLIYKYELSSTNHGNKGTKKDRTFLFVSFV